MSKAIGKRLLFWLGMFFLPISLFCLLAILGGVYPFGNESFLTEDLWYQYVDFFTWFRHALLGEATISYTGALSLGTNAWGIYSYYLASPLNIVVLLFDEAHITLAIFVLCAIKLGLIQATTTFYVHKRFDLTYVISGFLALCFTLCEWVVCNLRNPLWLDICYILPLALLGTWLFIRDGKLWRVAIPVAAGIMTCWYMGYIACLFLSLYALFEAANFHEKVPAFSGLAIVRRAGGFAGAMVLALGLSAWTFIPTVMTMAGDGTLTSFAPHRIAYISHALSSVFMGAYTLNASPQLFTGSIPLLLAVYYLFDKHKTIQSRLRYCLFVLLLCASIIVSTLYYVWCGLREPRGFYCRIAFLISLLLLWGSASSLKDIEEHGLSTLSGGLSLLTVMLLWAYSSFKGMFLSPIASALSFACICVGALIIWIYARRYEQKTEGNHALNTRSFFASSRLVWLGAYTFCIFELLMCAHLDWKQLYVGHSQQAQELYAATSSQQIEELKKLDPGFYRVDKTFTRALLAGLNEGLSHGYLQLSSYCSVHNPAAVNFLNALGYSNPGDFHVRYASPIALSDSLLGVTYVFEDDPNVPSVLYEEISMESVSDPVRLLKNPRALSLGYLVAPDVIDFDFDYLAEKPFEMQNKVISAALGREVSVYTRAHPTITLDTSSTKVWQFEVPKSSVGYVYVRGGASRGLGAFISIDNTEPIEDNWRFRHALYPLASGTHTVSLASTAEAASSQNGGTSPDLLKDIECEFYLLNIATFENALQELAQHQMELSTFNDGLIEGSIEADKPGYVMLTIPNERGWEVFVNDKQVAAYDAFEGACMAIPLEAGSNRVFCKFSPPGLLVGIGTSVVSIAVLAIVSWIQAPRRIKSQ